jgi:hypothetical protein
MVDQASDMNEKTATWKLARLRELILEIALARELAATGKKGVELWEILGVLKPEVVKCSQRIWSTLGEFECDAELGHRGDHHDRESDVMWRQGSSRPIFKG